MITKKIIIDDKEVEFATSAAIPSLYRSLFGEDIMLEMAELKDGIDKAEGSLPIKCLTIFEHIAFCMAKHADKTIPDDIYEWLAEFNTFSIYEILPEILELWARGTAQKSTPKK